MSDKHFNTMENYEMLKALYDFQAVYPKTISFDEGEYFILHQTSARQRNWWQVVSMKGNIGFVPSNYVMKLKVEPEFLIGFLDSSIESLKISKEVEINGIISRDELIQKLEEKKEMMQASFGQPPNPVSPPNEELPRPASFAENKDVVANGSVKNTENRVLDNCVPTRDENHKVYSNHKPEFTKKSMSSPAVSTQLPQLVTESPSMSVLATKLDQEPTTPVKSPAPPTVVTTTSTHQTGHYDNSIASEPSDNTTTTTTSDEITTVSKCDTTEKFNENDDNTNDSIIETKSPDASIKEVIDLKTEKNDSSLSHSAPRSLCAGDDGTGPLDNQEVSTATTSKSFKVDDQDVYQIIDAVRQNTNLSHELSCVALRIVLSELETIMPNEVLPYFESVASHLTGPLSAPDAMLGQTHDAQRLRIIFSDLAECKNDTEQRSWMLYEDEDDISRFLKDLIAILTHADPKICCHEMVYDQYQSTTNLVLYYQMETRWTIRKLILDALTAMCHLDFTAVNIILSSILPIELVEDMKVSITKVLRLKELATVLTIIFSIAQKMPITHEENLGTDFVLFLLTIIETPPDEDTMGILPDVMINLLLSFNLQFDDFANNIVLEALKKITDAKNFTEKILLLINREEDPIQILSHTSPPVNSVLKMFVDLFSTKETAALFYMNDNKVLIDILVRQLSDLSPGDKLRKWYLELCRRILRNTDYTEHTHRKQDLMKIFTRIFCEETECSAKDQQLVREIANEFPQIFKA